MTITTEHAGPLIPAGTYAVVLTLSFLSAITTCAGVALALRLRRSMSAIAAGIGFSAALMVLISVVELLPRASAALEAHALAAPAALGAAVTWLLNRLIPHTHLARERGLIGGSAVSTAYLVPLGLIIHDVPEGYAMASAYLAAPSAGVLVALAIALHNVPEEFAMSVAALAASDRKWLFRAAILSSLAEPAGALLGLVAVDFALVLNARIMAFAAGAMIFISLHELVPLARRHGRWELIAMGAVLAALTYFALDRLIAL